MLQDQEGFIADPITPRYPLISRRVIKSHEISKISTICLDNPMEVVVDRSFAR